LLYKLLCLHPDTAWISNWYRRLPGMPVVSVLNRIPGRFPERRRAVWFGPDSNAYVYGRRRPLAERLFPMPVEGEPVYTRCGIQSGSAASDIPPAALKDLSRRFDSLARYGAATTVVSKRIANNRRLPGLVATFPNATIIHLVRDGRAVALSLTKVDWWPESRLSWYDGTPRDWERDGGDPWDVAAREWVEEVTAVEFGLAGHDPARILTLHYEALVTSPVEVMEQVTEVTGLPVSPQWQTEVGRLRYPGRVDSWRSGLDDQALRRIEDIQRDVLVRYGYEA
jgi:hypothetical protein